MKLKLFLLGAAILVFTIMVVRADITVMLSDDMENGNFNLWTDNGATDWQFSTAIKHAGSNSAQATDVDLLLASDDLDMSDATAINVSFWYYISEIDANDDIYVSYWDGAVYDNINEIGDDAEVTWLYYQHTISDSQYFDVDFHIRIDSTSIDTGENLYIDDVIITKTYTPAAPDSCDCTSIQAGTTIECADNCDISACDANGQNLLFNGTGTITISGDITNIGSSVKIKGASSTNRCNVVCKGGCFKV